MDTATDYANSIVATPKQFSWRTFEEHGFLKYPKLAELFKAVTVELDSKERGSVWGWFMILPMLFLFFTVYLAPFNAVTFYMLGPTFNMSSNAISIAAGSFALISIGFDFLEWVRGKRGGALAEVQQLKATLVNIIFGFIAILMASVYAQYDSEILYPQLYILLFSLMTASSIASMAMYLVRKSRHAGEPEPELIRTPESNFQAGFIALTLAERDAIRSDFVKALEILVQAKIISKNDSIRALTNQIGGFAHWRWLYAPRKKKTRLHGRR